MRVDEDTIIGDILDHDPSVQKLFAELDMHCVGCPAARGETLAEACAIHGADSRALIGAINEYLQGK